MNHKVTVELNNRDFELLRSLCKQQGITPEDVISFALWGHAKTMGVLEDDLLSSLYGEPIYRVERQDEYVARVKKEKEGIAQ